MKTIPHSPKGPVPRSDPARLWLAPRVSRYARRASRATPQVSVVIPCFDEVATIPRLCAALDTTVAKLAAEGRVTEVIVVDDGSSDDSFAELKRAAATRPWLRLVRFRRNFGQT